MTRSLPFLALGAFILFGADFVRAQDVVSEKVKVPFAFRAGRAILPAGEYDVRFDYFTMPGVLRVRSANGRETSLMLVQASDLPRGSNDTPHLVFDKDGDSYVLTEVVDPGSDRALLVAGAHEVRERVHPEAGAE